MSKHLIIDGYNLLGAIGRGTITGGPEGEAMRETLLQDLTRYRQRIEHSITVVFDAWRQVGGIQRQEHRAGVTVIFSRQGEQADQVIQRMVREYGRDSAVVSSDHEVINVARSHGAFVIRSQEFLSKLPSQSKFSFSRFPTKSDKEDVPDSERRLGKKGNPRKLPKAVRHRIRNLKKF